MTRDHRDDLSPEARRYYRACEAEASRRYGPALRGCRIVQAFATPAEERALGPDPRRPILPSLVEPSEARLNGPVRR